MNERIPSSAPEEPTFDLDINPAERMHLVDALKMVSENAWELMGEMMDKIEAQVQDNSAEGMCSLFFAQAAIYFDAGLIDAGISALNDAHIYAHNMKSEALAQSIYEMITLRGGVPLYEPHHG